MSEHTISCVCLFKMLMWKKEKTVNKMFIFSIIFNIPSSRSYHSTNIFTTKAKMRRIGCFCCCGSQSHKKKKRKKELSWRNMWIAVFFHLHPNRTHTHMSDVKYHFCILIFVCMHWNNKRKKNVNKRLALNSIYRLILSLFVYEIVKIAQECLSICFAYLFSFFSGLLLLRFGFALNFIYFLFVNFYMHFLWVFGIN